jgi:ADP-ribose diphosphatase
VIRLDIVATATLEVRASVRRASVAPTAVPLVSPLARKVRVYNGGMRTPPIVHARRQLDPTGRFRVEEVDLEFANGARRTFERLQSGGLGAVIIVPMHDADTVLLVREYAAGLHRYELGLPKGRIDAGEDATQAANRELKEEIGFGARELLPLVPLALAPSYMAHRTQVVLARDLYPEKLEGDEPEELDVVPWRLDELNALIGHPECSEGRTLAALFIAREFLAGRWQPPSDASA